MSGSSRELLTRQVYEYLKDQLTSRQIERGAHLKAADIADALSVSRTTVRKAIARLIDDGYLRLTESGRPMVVALPRKRTTENRNGFDFTNQTESAYWAIFERVFQGRYHAGEDVKGQELADELGVSLGTVRQALDWLCRGGLFVRQPRRGWKLVSLSRQDVEDAFRFRLLLEPEALRRAIPQFDPDVLSQLQNQCEEILRNGQKMSEYVRRRADYSFHHAILEQARSTILMTMVDPLIRKCMLVGVFQPVSHQVSLQSFREHREVLDAVQKQDEATATSKLKAHMERSLSVFVSKYGDE